jgi:atypical dual specificity phosphatase
LRLVLRGHLVRAWSVCKLLLGRDRGDWIEEGSLLGCPYPRRDRSLAELSERGVSLLVNLHERQHDPVRLKHHGLTEVHLPLRDFAAPSPEQIERGVAAIVEAQGAGEVVAVHCGGGFGRTGTLLACYLIQRHGLDAAEAIQRVRKARPGSVETREQAEAVEAFAWRQAR